jgi:hypothetical protein
VAQLPSQRLVASSGGIRRSTSARTHLLPVSTTHDDDKKIYRRLIYMAAIAHVIAFLVGIGYIQNYYFHLSM